MMFLPDEIEKVLKELLLRFEKYGLSGDLYIEAGLERSVTFRKGKLTETRENRFSGCGMRVEKQGKVVTLSSATLDRESLFRLLENGRDTIRYASVNPYFKLRERIENCPGPEIFDKELLNLPRDVLEDYASKLEGELRSLSRDFVNTEGSFRVNVREVLILNTKGLRAYFKETSCSLGASCTAERKGERFESGAWTGRRFLKDLPETEMLAKEAAERSLALLGGKPIETKKAPVVLERRVASGLMWNIFNLVNGEEINRGRSLFKGKLGEKVGSEKITIIDDGTKDRMLGSRGFDDEGTCTKRKLVIEKGVLKTYLDNLSTALEGKRGPTGNGFRGGFRGTLGVSPTNFYLEPGDYLLDDILREAEGGLYVMNTMGFGVDPITGNFSLGAQGRLIEGGRPGRPVTGVTIAGKFEKILNSIEMVGKELIFDGSIASPPLLIKEMMIAGV